MYKKLLWGIHLPRENSDKHTYLITVFYAFYSTGLCIKKLCGIHSPSENIDKHSNIITVFQNLLQYRIMYKKHFMGHTLAWGE
jgi:hypothetical protein